MKKNIYSLRNEFTLREYNTAITLHLQRLGRQELRRREPQRRGLPHGH